MKRKKVNKLPNILNLRNKNKQVGKIEIRNQTEDSAELYFYGDIASESWQSEWYEDDKCPEDVRAFLDEVGEVKQLDIHINSGGGSVFGGIAIYNLLKAKNCHKDVWVDGIAASISSVIACAGDVIHMPKNSTFMIHKPLNSYFFISMNADDLRKDAETLDQCQKAITATYMTKVKDGVTEETITELINNETWLIGDEAEDYFDFEIVESNDAAACSSTYFDKYQHLPENLKPKEEKSKDVVSVDLDGLADKILEKLDAKAEAKAKAEKEQLEANKQNLLKDLDQFGR